MNLPRTLILCFGLLAATLLNAQTNDLRIYWTDVEGGAATLIVTPAGQALLVDAGFPQDDRDAKRILRDHQGSRPQEDRHVDHHPLSSGSRGRQPALAKLIPIEQFYDHGESIEGSTPAGSEIIRRLQSFGRRARRTIVKPGDKIPLKGAT